MKSGPALVKELGGHVIPEAARCICHLGPGSFHQAQASGRSCRATLQTQCGKFASDRRWAASGARTLGAGSVLQVGSWLRRPWCCIVCYQAPNPRGPGSAAVAGWGIGGVRRGGRRWVAAPHQRGTAQLQVSGALELR